MKLKPWFDKVKTTEPGSGNEEIQNITIPSELGGFVDMILGISFSKVHPVPVHTFPDGLTIYKSRFLPVNPGIVIKNPLRHGGNLINVFLMVKLYDFFSSSLKNILQCC